MRGKKEIAILVFIISVLVFYIYSEKGDKTHYDLPDIDKIEADSIGVIKITKEGRDITLVREADRWLVGEKRYPADRAMVENILRNISGLALTALASESENYSLYELDEKSRIDVEAYKDDSLLRRISIGKTASSYRHTFVMLDDDVRVFHGQGNIRGDFDKTVAELRDKNVMTVRDDISEILLHRGGEEMKIIRAEAPVSVDVTKTKEEEEPAEKGPRWITSDGKTVKEAEADGIVQTLTNFRCDEFIEEKGKEDFTAPVFTATLKGLKTYTISLFEKQDNQYPAISSESEYPFLIFEWKAKRIMKDFGSLIEEGK